MNNAFSSRKGIIYSMPQGSMLELILFNKFIADLFPVIDDIDLALMILQSIVIMIGDDVIASLTESAEKLFQCFSVTKMKRNTDKCCRR